ncbi:MAG: AAA family ATPase [Gammaproteobacteria bacterium]|nr:AAA family ATPase [Gammaproteobacteria bacterium]
MVMSIQKEGVQLICGADLEPEMMPWVWKNWLVAGKVHILGGEPGTGKTTIALSLAATITMGGLWPDRTSSEPGNILIASDTNNLQSTLLPGLLAHGANPNHISFMPDFFKHRKTRAFDWVQAISQLYEKASKIGGLKLIMIDPMVYFYSHNVQRNVEFRRGLQSLAALGKQLNAVILGICPFTQQNLEHDPVERVIRSLGGSTLPRVVLVTAQEVHPDGKVLPVLLRVKSTYAPEGGGYYYDLKKIELPHHPGVFSSQVVWGDSIERNTVTLKK